MSTATSTSPCRSLPGRTSAFTRCPWATRSWTRFEPMKPEAPVTKHFIGRKFRMHFAATRGRLPQKVFPILPRLTWRRGSENYAVVCGQKAPPKKAERRRSAASQTEVPEWTAEKMKCCRSTAGRTPPDHPRPRRLLRQCPNLTGARAVPTRSGHARPEGVGFIQTRLWLAMRCGLRTIRALKTANEDTTICAAPLSILVSEVIF